MATVSISREQTPISWPTPEQEPSPVAIRPTTDLPGSLSQAKAEARRSRWGRTARSSSGARTIQPTTAQAGKRARDSPARRVSHRIGSIRKSSMRSPTEPCTPALMAQRHSPRPPRGCRAAGGRQRFLEWKGKSGWRPEAICTARRARARARPRSRVLHKCIRSASARPPRVRATPLCTSSARWPAFPESFARPTKA